MAYRLAATMRLFGAVVSVMRGAELPGSAPMGPKPVATVNDSCRR